MCFAPFVTRQERRGVPGSFGMPLISRRSPGGASCLLGSNAGCLLFARPEIFRHLAHCVRNILQILTGKRYFSLHRIPFAEELCRILSLPALVYLREDFLQIVIRNSPQSLRELFKLFHLTYGRLIIENNSNDIFSPYRSFDERPIFL